MEVLTMIEQACDQDVTRSKYKSCISKNEIKVGHYLDKLQCQKHKDTYTLQVIAWSTA